MKKKFAFTLAKGAMHVAMPPVFSKVGFTLAEVLITLGIIGIVAAMTIPTLLTKLTEDRTVTQLRAVQSILSQTIRSAEEEYGSMEGWEITDYDEASAILIADKLKPFMKVALDCGVNDENAHCAPNMAYKYLKGTNETNYATNSISHTYKIVLMNGCSIYIRGGQPEAKSIAVFYVDTNGKAKPNTWGRDFFQFYYLPVKGLYPAGHPEQSSASSANSCNLNNTGFGCAYYVLHNKNMKYLRK